MDIFDILKSITKEPNKDQRGDHSTNSKYTKEEIAMIKKHNLYVDKKLLIITNKMSHILEKLPLEIQYNFCYKIRIKLLLSDCNIKLSANQIKESDNVLKDIDEDIFLRLLNELVVLKIVNKLEDGLITKYVDGPKIRFNEFLLVEIYKVQIEEEIEKAKFQLEPFKELQEEQVEYILNKVRVLHAIKSSFRPILLNEFALYDKALEEFGTAKIEIIIKELINSENIIETVIKNEDAYSFLTDKDFIKADVNKQEYINNEIKIFKNMEEASKDKDPVIITKRVKANKKTDKVEVKEPNKIEKLEVEESNKIGKIEVEEHNEIDKVDMDVSIGEHNNEGKEKLEKKDDIDNKGMEANTEDYKEVYKIEMEATIGDGISEVSNGKTIINKKAN
ncbi:hypothetical protein [Clostridium algidicarnis]|uniref:hypothetical protein n=1 Tax=Clostridium algidicarnis TaxID=37659 RepID=UPI001623D76D|nr:hypothetical protein [Clostridium algidicarnis]MBB6630770.1 hypothetical protein [Clostridium algidicarnis]